MMEFLTDPNILIALVTAVIIVLVVYSILDSYEQMTRKVSVPEITVGNAQTIGLRQRQEDSFASDVQGYGTFAIVADGIGSFVDGKKASEVAVRTFLREFKKENITDHIGYFYKKTAASVHGILQNYYDDIPAGTTIAAAIINQNILHYAWAGDSSIAVYRNGRLIPLNRKHTLENKLEELYQQGKITKEQALQQQYGKRLVNYLGSEEYKEVDVNPRPLALKKGDLVLLYTDGLETLSELQMEEILESGKSPQEMAEHMIETINESNAVSKDNATVIIISINKEYKHTKRAE